MGKKQNKSKNKKEKKRKKRYIGFFAYPSEPKDRSEIIEKAILELNKNNSLNIISWTKPDRKGSRIISDIYENIHKSDFFIADISNLNLNVLFEVGLAFGKRKKILLFTQGFSSNDRQKDLQDLEILSGLRIETYESSDHIVKKVSDFLVELERKQPEIDRYVENLYSSSDQLKGLFLKGLTNHDICLTALESFKKIFQIYKVDDWNEVSTQLLRWYLKEVIDSYGVVALFVDSAWDQSRKINSRFSFICGLAIALNKKVLMIGLPGFNVPFDYKEILKKPDSTKNAEEIIKEFGAELCNEMPSVSEISPKAEADLSKKSLKKNEKEIILLDINLGDSIAENEENELNNYFVETGQFRKALTVRQAIIIGNKGSGKTANFYQIRDHFKYSNAKNLICEIKPSDYKIERFLASLKRLGNEEGLQGHVLENVWKMIIYSELMKNLYEEYSSRPISIGLSNNEQKLKSFVERHYNLICSPFERKLDIAADWLEDVMYSSDDFSMKIHSEFLSEGINILYPNLKNRAKIVVLIDNLDKAWKVHSNLDVQSKIIFNLLGIHRRLQSDFGNDVSVLIFLRRNIFEYILENQAREPDKLIADSIELLWNDPDMLIRVIEKRFNEAFKRYYPDIYGKYTWESFFASSVNNIPIKIWLYNNTLPRPRDLIQFVQKAIEWAINRGHEEILEPDLVSALESYSSFALSQIIAEYAAEEPWLINVLNSFNGGKEIYKFNELYDHIKRSSNISDKSKILEMIATLVNIGFIGVKVNGSEIEFAHNLQTSRKLISLVKNSPQNKKLIFAIHHVFHKYLNIISSDENQNRGPTNIIAWLKNKLQEVL